MSHLELRFTSLPQLEHLVLVVCETEGTIDHGRLKAISTQHRADISHAGRTRASAHPNCPKEQKTKNLNHARDFIATLRFKTPTRRKN